LSEKQLVAWAISVKGGVWALLTFGQPATLEHILDWKNGEIDFGHGLPLGIPDSISSGDVTPQDQDVPA
jgi:hypothetical protein